MGLGKGDEVVEREGLGTCVGLSDFFFFLDTHMQPKCKSA